MTRLPWNPEHFDGLGHHLGAPGIVGLVLMIILWAAVIAALVLGVRALILHSRRNRLSAVTEGPTAGSAPGVTTGVSPVSAQTSTEPGGTLVAETPAVETPALLAILQERYARGEIDRDEFLRRKEDLGLS